MAEQHDYTYEDLLQFPEDDLFRREIIDGELIVSAAPVVRHQVIVGRLHLAFANFVAEHGGADVYIAPLDVLFSDRNVVEPDLVIVGADRLDIVNAKNIKGIPSLLIEVVSDPRSDRVRKRDLYSSYEVPEYWVVDPDADRAEVHRFMSAGYGKPEIYEPPEVLEVGFLPGFRLDLSKLFAR